MEDEKGREGSRTCGDARDDFAVEGDGLVVLGACVVEFVWLT